MTQYYPEGWKLIRVREDTIKVFASFFGGYLSGDSWKLNSGVVKIIEKKGLLYVHGYSGSIYVLNKLDEDHLSTYTRSVLENILEETEKQIPGEVYCLEMEDVLKYPEKYEIEYIKEE